MEVTEELQNSGMVFGLIIFIVFGTFAVSTIYDVIKPSEPKDRKEALMALPVFILMCVGAVYITLAEYNFLYNSVIVEGTTIGYCREPKVYHGIVYEYIFKGKRHTRCSDCSQIKRIKVPGANSM